MPRDARYGSARWRSLREQVIRRDGRRCAVPGCPSDMSERRMTQVDHIVEVRDGGAFWDVSNLRTVCRYHHYSKSMATLGERQAGRRSAILQPFDPANPPPGCTCRPRNVSPKSPNDFYCDACEAVRRGGADS